jgi:hypothetical protein
MAITRRKLVREENTSSKNPKKIITIFFYSFLLFLVSFSSYITTFILLLLFCYYYFKICKHNMKCFNCIYTSTFYFSYEIWHPIFVIYLFILLWRIFLCARYLRIWNLHSLNLHFMCANKYLFIFWSLIWTNQMNSYIKY